MHILSIETSCDDTAVAILKYDGAETIVLANTVSSQISLHTQYGGVVPALASREHMNNIVPVIEATLAQTSLTEKDIDLIAVTEGPGLMPALIIGVSTAKTLSLVWSKPLIGIHHIEGHIYANFLGKKEKEEDLFPLIALVVSGGHTQLILMRSHFDYTILGETQDDAAGEAFDKVARLLGLPYPGGPEIGKRADAFRTQNEEKNIREITEKFPRPMITSDTFDFSFSGLKTSVLYSLQKETPEKLHDEEFIASMCHAFQESVVDVLVTKTKKALIHYAPKTFIVAGGVSANTRLRERLATMITHLNTENNPERKIQFLTPEFSYSLDNAVMIGIASAFRYEQMSTREREALTNTFLTLDPNANLPLRNIVH